MLMRLAVMSQNSVLDIVTMEHPKKLVIWILDLPPEVKKRQCRCRQRYLARNMAWHISIFPAYFRRFPYFWSHVARARKSHFRKRIWEKVVRKFFDGPEFWTSPEFPSAYSRRRNILTSFCMSWGWSIAVFGYEKSKKTYFGRVMRNGLKNPGNRRVESTFTSHKWQ